MFVLLNRISVVYCMCGVIHHIFTILLFLTTIQTILLLQIIVILHLTVTTPENVNVFIVV